MFLPGYQPKPAAADWQKDKAGLAANMAKLKNHSGRFTPEAREMRRKSIEDRRISLERRRTSDQMRRDGVDPKKIKHYILTGEK